MLLSLSNRIEEFFYGNKNTKKFLSPSVYIDTQDGLDYCPHDYEPQEHQHNAHVNNHKHPNASGEDVRDEEHEQKSHYYYGDNLENFSHQKSFEKYELKPLKHRKSTKSTENIARTSLAVTVPVTIEERQLFRHKQEQQPQQPPLPPMKAMPKHIPKQKSIQFSSDDRQIGEEFYADNLENFCYVSEDYELKTLKVSPRRGKGVTEKGNISPKNKKDVIAIDDYFPLGTYEDAKRSANNELQLTKGKNTKAWFRRGCAFASLGDITNAYYDYLSAQILSPDDEQIKRAATDTLSVIEVNCKKIETEQNQKSLSFWTDQLGEYKNEFLQSTSVNELCLSNQSTTVVVACLRILLIQKLSLQKLEILNTKMTLNITIALKAYLLSISTLQRLSVSSTSMDAYSMSLLVDPLKQQNNLSSLDLSDCCLRHFGCYFIKSLCTDSMYIKSLYLGNTGIGDVGLVEIVTALIHNKHVETIYLNNNNLGDESVPHIISLLVNYPKFECISLANNDISSSGLLKIMRTFFDCPHIQSLDLNGMCILPSEQADVQNIVEQHNERCLSYISERGERELTEEETIVQRPEITELYF